jgi:hypothetical protein
VADETPLALEVLRTAGPFVAAVVALYIAFRSERRDRRRQPDLRLLFDPATDDIEVATEEHEKHWVRLRVANRWGRRTAEDVEVLIVDVQPRLKASLNGFTLAWANPPESDHRWPTVPLPARQTIPPGTARHIDVLNMAPRSGWGSDDVIEGVTLAYIALQAQPERRDDRHVLSDGHWYVLLAVTARDTDATFYGVTIDFDGLWWSGEHVKDHLNLSVGKAHHFVFGPERERRRGFAWRSRIRA